MWDKIIKILVNRKWKRERFLAWSWGFDENTNIHIITEEFFQDRHRFGVRDEEDKIRIYSKIFADEEPRDKADKLSRICVSEELVEVMKWLKEYIVNPEIDEEKIERIRHA